MLAQEGRDLDLLPLWDLATLRVEFTGRTFMSVRGARIPGISRFYRIARSSILRGRILRCFSVLLLCRTQTEPNI